MHQAYFERKMSQPSTSSNSRSLTPKPFTRLQEDPTKSPERISTEYSQFAHHSPTVSSHKNLTANISFVPSKMSAKNREQIINTERLRNRSQQTQYYNPKNLHNVTTDLMRGKNPSRGNYIMTKTEPSVDLETSYASQVNKLLQKINKLKFDLGQSQERENQYLSKLSNLEKENKSLQMVIEERDKRILDITQKSKEDKLRMYQFLTELETHKQNNAEQCRGDDVSTLRLSELCDSSRKGEKGYGLEKGTQTVEGSGSSYECPRCESVTSYCDHLITKLNEVDQASKVILKEYNSMKESMVKAKRAETDFVRARNEIEKRALEIQNDYDKQAVFYNEVMAENSTVRNTLKEAIDSNMVSFQSSSDQKKLVQNKASNIERSQKKILPIPASLRALVGAERILKAAAN